MKKSPKEKRVTPESGQACFVSLVVLCLNRGRAYLLVHKFVRCYSVSAESLGHAMLAGHIDTGDRSVVIH